MKTTDSFRRFSHPPKQLFEHRVSRPTPRLSWLGAQRDSCQHSELLVLRAYSQSCGRPTDNTRISPRRWLRSSRQPSDPLHKK
jgi:hypothetical protein